jgi:uncharacterized membrane protein YjjP (DUF1212 family)
LSDYYRGVGIGVSSVTVLWILTDIIDGPWWVDLPIAFVVGFLACLIGNTIERRRTDDPVVRI